MPSSRIRRGPLNARNTWTVEQRRVLHVLCTQFNLDWYTRTAVFNELFKEYQRTQNILGGLSKNTLAAQYAERDKKSRLWQIPCQQPSTDEEWHERHELTAKIQNIAATLASNQSRARVKCCSGASSLAQRWDAEANHLGESDLRATRHQIAQVPLPTIIRAAARVKQSLRDSPEEMPTTPATPCRRSGRNLDPATPTTKRTMEYVRSNGVALMLTPKQYELVQRPLVPVPEAIARPTVAGLFYRYWDENSFGTNTEHGFLAGRFPRNNVRGPVPKSTDLVWEDLEIHIGGEKIPTPFISVANNLVWTIRKALQHARKGAVHGKITLIDAGRLSGTYYHLLPFDVQLCKRYAFTGGKIRYVSKHEFICWREIPENAVLHTFSLRNLQDVCQRIPHLEETLRFDMIGSRASFVSKVVISMREDPLHLFPETVVAIARFCRFLGFDPSSQLKHVEHIIADVVAGWSISVPQQSSDDWANYATLFTQTFCGHQTITTFTREQELSAAFLFGLRLAHGGFNTFHHAKSIEAMHRKATVSGLESPAKIILDALVKASAAVTSYGEDQDVRYEEAILKASASAATATLLPGVDEYFRLGSNVCSPTTAGTPGAGASEDDDEIMYDGDALGL